jgi:hypothetical protein
METLETWLSAGDLSRFCALTDFSDLVFYLGLVAK